MPTGPHAPGAGVAARQPLLAGALAATVAHQLVPLCDIPDGRDVAVQLAAHAQLGADAARGLQLGEHLEGGCTRVRPCMRACTVRTSSSSSCNCRCFQQACPTSCHIGAELALASRVALLPRMYRPCWARDSITLMRLRIFRKPILPVGRQASH